jgi:glycosyltransferase involved in cell wall biosynthesis
MNPKVSICIPAFNQTKYLKRVLESVFEQTFTDYEVVISDDSTTGDVQSLMEDFSRYNQKIRYFKNEPPLGSATNWNELMRKARGVYIKFMHHDDWFISVESLQKFVDALDQNPGAGLAFSAYVAYYEKEDVFIHYKPTFSQLEQLRTQPMSLFFGNFISTPSNTIFKKTQLLFEERLKWLVDVDFYIRYLEQKKTFAHLSEELVLVVGNASHNITNGCQHNPSVEIFEHTLVFNNFKSKLNLLSRIRYASFLVDKFRSFGIQKISEIHQFTKGEKTDFMVKLIFITKIIFAFILKMVLKIRYQVISKLTFVNKNKRKATDRD